MAFFGRYIDVTPHSRLVWTNDESEDGAVTTVTFEEKGGKTLLVMHELYPSRKHSTVPSPGWRVGWARCWSNWTSCSSPRTYALGEPLLETPDVERKRTAGYLQLIGYDSGPNPTVLCIEPRGALVFNGARKPGGMHA